MKFVRTLWSDSTYLGIWQLSHISVSLQQQFLYHHCFSQKKLSLHNHFWSNWGSDRRGMSTPYHLGHLYQDGSSCGQHSVSSSWKRHMGTTQGSQWQILPPANEMNSTNSLKFHTIIYLLARGIYLLTQVWSVYIAAYSWHGPAAYVPRIDILGTNILGTHLLTSRGWTAEFADGL